MSAPQHTTALNCVRPSLEDLFFGQESFQDYDSRYCVAAAGFQKARWDGSIHVTAFASADEALNATSAGRDLPR
jgi:hypothetical protein